MKPWQLAKSRLGVDRARCERLAESFALDVLDALTASTRVGHVVIVSSQSALAAEGARAGATVLVDRPLLSSDGLNDAVELGRHWAMARRPSAPVAVVPADLATLTSTALDAFLAQVSDTENWFVPDRTGRGTTVLTAPSPALLRSSYGEDSALRHVTMGQHPFSGVDPVLRVDVDDLNDLQEAHRLGLGRRSGAAYAEVLCDRRSAWV